MTRNFNLSASLLAALVAIVVRQVESVNFKVKIEHDMSKPTYGLIGPSSSQLTYSPRQGLKLRGTIKDVLGPPIKVARGVGNIIKGSSKLENQGDIRDAMRTKGAILAVDANTLEAAGGSNLLQGGILSSIQGAKTGMAGLLHAMPGQKLANIIELPVKVVNLKDFRANKDSESNPPLSGEALRRKGFNQMMEGASEGVQNIGNMVHSASDNAASAFRLLPIIMDMQREDYERQQKEKEQKNESTIKGNQQPAKDTSQQMQHNPLVAGLNSLLSSGGGLAKNNQAAPANLDQSYAAMLNAENPLTSLLMNPNLNLMLSPISEGPLAQSLAGKLSGVQG